MNRQSIKSSIGKTWKVRAAMICFAALMLWIGVGAVQITKEVLWLRLFGTEIPARITDIYQQGGDDAGGWFITYEYQVAGKIHTGVSSVPFAARIGNEVVIVFLPSSPAVSNTRAEVRLGSILGPLGVFPVGLILGGLGVWLLLKALFASSAELLKKTETEPETETQ